MVRCLKWKCMTVTNSSRSLERPVHCLVKSLTMKCLVHLTQVHMSILLVLSADILLVFESI